MVQDEYLLSLLVQKNLLTEDKARAILEKSKLTNKKAERLINENKLVDEEQLAQIKSELFKLPVKIFKKNEIIPHNVLHLIPEDTARHYQLVAFEKNDKNVSIAMVYPDDIEAQEALKFLMTKLNLQFQIYITTPSSIKYAFSQYLTFTQEFNRLIEDFHKQYATKTKKETSPYKLVNLESTHGVVAEEAPIIKLFAAILKFAVRSRASDIHLEPESGLLRVRLRIDGKLSTALYLPFAVHAPLISRIKIMTNLKIDETRIPQDGRFFAMIDEKQIDFRVSTFPTSFGEKVAIRILDPSIGLKNINELGLSGKNLTILQEEIQRPYGMVLITGPTGSGKTTTLYAILQVLNQEKVNIVSVEDPVEYSIEGINQSQIFPEIGYTFARGLRHIVRQDPDIIMVGEIRDSETAQLAVQAALTGHLVLSTLHTNNAIGVIPRLLDLGVEPFLIPSTVNLMIAQRLARKLCDDCKVRVIANEKETKIIEENLASLPKEIKEQQNLSKPFYIYKPKGCPTCNYKGYLGRIGVFEMIRMSKELEEIILTQPSQDKLIEEAKRQGMISLRQDGILKVLEGITSLEEILAIT